MTNSKGNKMSIITLLGMLFILLFTNNAYLWINPSYITETKIIPSDGDVGDAFGWALDIDGDTLVVNSEYDDCEAGTSCGSVYVFRYNGTTWVEETKLTASEAASGVAFGDWALAVDGDVVVVGCSQCNDAGPLSGSTYVYRNNGKNWVEEAKLTASDAAAWEYFGMPVDIDGDRIVIGAAGGWETPPWTQDIGSAYLFKHNGTNWAEEVKLTASDAAPGDKFGWHAAIDGDIVVIGAYGDDDAGDNSGSVYVFRYNGTTWVEETKLTASDGAAEDWFGWSVGLDGNILSVGASGDDCDAGIDCGSVYLFRYNGTNWVEEAKLTANDADARDFFGDYGLALDGHVVVVGAIGDSDAGDNSGSAYVFNLSKQVEIDIKPESEDNCLNINDHGVIIA